MLFPSMVVPIYIPTNKAAGISFLHFLNGICYLLSCFHTSHFNRCKVISHCDFFNLYFLDYADGEHLFMYLLSHLYGFFRNYLFRFYAHFLICVCVCACACYRVVKVFYVFWVLTLWVLTI